MLGRLKGGRSVPMVPPFPMAASAPWRFPGCLMWLPRAGCSSRDRNIGDWAQQPAASTSCHGTVSLCQVATEETHTPCTSHAGKACVGALVSSPHQGPGME